MKLGVNKVWTICPNTTNFVLPFSTVDLPSKILINPITLHIHQEKEINCVAYETIASNSFGQFGRTYRFLFGQMLQNARKMSDV